MHVWVSVWDILHEYYKQRMYFGLKRFRTVDVMYYI